MKDSSSRPQPDCRLSRRDLLHGASAGIAASLGASLLPAFGYSQGRRQAATDSPAAQSGPVSPASMPKGFSKEEFQRRWKRVRELMKEAHLDCLIVPREQGESEQPPTTAYLTGTGAGWVVFPYDGTVTAIGAGGEGRANNDLGIELHPDGRPAGSVSGNAEGGFWSPAIIDSLREKGMSKARIGVGDLMGLPRNEEGGVSYTTLDRVIKAFPQAKFESAANLLIRAMLVHGPEEIAVLEKADAISELGAQAMLDTARPGVSALDVWIKMYETMLRASGEPGGIALVLEGTRTTQPRGQVLRAGDIVNQEITGKVMGYTSQVNQGICIGSPAPPEWAPAAQFAVEVFQRSVDWIAPGKTIKDLMDFYVKLLATKGLKETGTTVIYHLGIGPRMGPNRREGKDLVIEAGWVFHTVKPTIPLATGSRSYARIGDAVVVTDQGARRLGKRRLDVFSAGA